MKKTNNTINTIGCDNIIDNAFVPNEDKAPALTIADFFDNDYKVNKRHFGVPAVGEHRVVLDGEPEVRKNDDGNYYFVLNLMDEKGLCWKTFANPENLNQTLETISFFNEGMLANKKGMVAINYLQGHKFSCWVLKNEKGKAYTYFDKAKYDKRIYVMSRNEERKELGALREKERADNKARMAEEAKMGRENDEIPFDV